MNETPADTVFDFKAKYGQPKDLVFDGLLYCKTSMNPGKLHGLSFAKVVALEYEDDNETEPMEAGPELVVFNCAVYQRSMTPPEDIEDDVLRTVDALSPFSANLLPPQLPTASPGQPLSTHILQRAMPPRSQVINRRALSYLFDLPANQRAGVQIHPPSRFNPPIVVQHGQVKPRLKWAPEHTKYLYELMELAMLTLNRPLKPQDFPAITEALHRKFQGTINVNIPYLERGYHTIHSYATRKQPYDELVRRVLPDQCKNRAQWTPRNHQ